MKTIKHILVVNLAGLGDILLSIPSLKALRELYPSERISMLVSPKLNEMVKMLPFIDEIFTLDMGFGGAIPLNKIFRNAGVLMALRIKRFDLAINMRTLASKKGAVKIKLLFQFINPRTSAGRDTEGRGYFFDIRIPETDTGRKYEMEYDLDMVRALGGMVRSKSIDMEIDETSAEKVKIILERHGVSDDDVLVGLHPGGMQSRRWHGENYSRVMEQISRDVNCKFVFTGSRDETGLANRIQNSTAAKAIDLTGALNIDELFALIKRCDLYLSNDTGPMHIAAVLQTPLIAIFGPGDVTRFDPRNISDKAIVMHEEKECAPCNKEACESMQCLRAISPDDVTEASLKLLRTYKQDLSSLINACA